MTRAARYNIMNQYDEKRNSKEPKPRSLADFDRVIENEEMIHRRETNEDLYG